MLKCGLFLVVFFSHFEHYPLNALSFFSCQESQSQASPKRPPSSDASALGSSEDTSACDRPAKSPSVESSGENCHSLPVTSAGQEHCT